MSRKYKNYHKNPRAITEDQQIQLKKWIIEFGDLSGIVVNNLSGEKVCGNQRGNAIDLDKCEVDIVKKYDTPDSVGTVAEGFVLFDGVKLNYREVEWDERRTEQANIIANKAGGAWDWEILTEGFEINDLLEWGFSEEEFAGKDVEVEPEETKGDDDIPEVQEQAETVKGDLWELGEHRLLCGDSTLIDDVERLMNGEKADMVFTDPPYGISIVSKDGSVGGGTKGKYSLIKGDGDINVAVDSFNLCVSLDIPIMFFWGANHYSSKLPDSSCWVVWDKQGGKSVDFADCELCYTNLEKPVRMFTHIWDGFRRDSEKGEMRVHPTQKPVQLFVDIWDKFECPKTVLDLFGGSGSTLIGAETTGRKSRLMELDEKYCDVIVKRYVKFCIENDRPYTVKLNGEDYNGSLLGG
tara:strand:+ start:47 stop:1273 length:1227 start_codon:yes stop_codon:yes gene_type:complete